jgi:hypothetical protein
MRWPSFAALRLRAAAFVLAVLLLAATPSVTRGQVFLATNPNPDFAIGPLFVNVNVRPDLSAVSVNLSWSLTPAPGRPATDIKQDLYLLWPAEVTESTAPGPADPSLVRYLDERGFTTIRSGRLTLRARDRLQLGTGSIGEPIETVVSYATFVRRGTAAQLGAGTYVKVPWTPKLADPLSVITLVLPLRGLIVPKPATWTEELFWGRRYIVTGGFGDVGSLVLPLYPLYFEQRSRVIHLAREFSLVIVNFADSDHLRIEEMSPASATRRQSRVRAGNEVVTMVLAPSEGITPQTVKVVFSYFLGPIAWRPVLITIAFLLAGNVTGVLLFGRDVVKTLRTRRARRRLPGPLPGRDAFASLVSDGLSYDDVVARFGQPDEEHERLAPSGRRSLMYRRTRRNGAGLETAEIEITLDDGHVREVHHRIKRRSDP